MTRFAIPCFAGTLACLALLPGGTDAQVPSSYTAYQRSVPAYSSGYWGYAYSPYAGLFGLADLVRAQGDYLVQREKAGIVREEKRQAQLETYKKKLELLSWERDFHHQEWKKERERNQERDLLKAQDARGSYQETLKGLNVLSERLRLDPGLDAAPVPIDPTVLEHINFKVLGGNIGLLKQDRIPWPLVLMDDRFAADRDEVERVLGKMKEMAKVDPLAARYGDLAKHLKTLQNLEGKLKVRLENEVKDLSPGEYIEAMRMVKSLHESVNAMKRPEEAALLYHGFGACKTVPELVKQMGSQGVSFGDAIEGNERYYFILWDAYTRQYKQMHPDK